MANSYNIAGVYFPTQNALEEAVRKRVQAEPLDKVFQSRLLRDVVNELHPDVAGSPNRSDGRFQKLSFESQSAHGIETSVQYRGGYLMFTYFIPIEMWHDVTVFPWRGKRNAKAKIVTALRTKAKLLQPLPRPWDVCAITGCKSPGEHLEYHHISPTFKEISAACLEVATQEEKDSLFGYSKFKLGMHVLADFISDDHPIILKLKELHSGNEWQWLCQEHHRRAL